MRINDLDHLQSLDSVAGIMGGMEEEPDFDVVKQAFDNLVSAIQLDFDNVSSGLESSFDNVSFSFPDSLGGGGFTRPSFSRARISTTSIGRSLDRVAPTEGL